MDENAIFDFLLASTTKTWSVSTDGALFLGVNTRREGPRWVQIHPLYAFQVFDTLLGGGGEDYYV